MRCVIWYHLYNVKNVKNTHGGVLILVKLQPSACNFTKINSPSWVFFAFFKLYEWYQIVQRITNSWFNVPIFQMLIFILFVSNCVLFEGVLSLWVSIRKATEIVTPTTTYFLRIDTGTIITAGLQAITRTNLVWECTIHKLYVIYCCITGLHRKHQLPTCGKIERLRLCVLSRETFTVNENIKQKILWKSRGPRYVWSQRKDNAE